MVDVVVSLVEGNEEHVAVEAGLVHGLHHFGLEIIALDGVVGVVPVHVAGNGIDSYRAGALLLHRGVLLAPNLHLVFPDVVVAEEVAGPGDSVHAHVLRIHRHGHEAVRLYPDTVIGELPRLDIVVHEVPAGIGFVPCARVGAEIELAVHLVQVAVHLALVDDLRAVVAENVGEIADLLVSARPWIVLEHLRAGLPVVGADDIVDIAVGSLADAVVVGIGVMEVGVDHFRAYRPVKIYGGRRSLGKGPRGDEHHDYDSEQRDTFHAVTPSRWFVWSFRSIYYMRLSHFDSRFGPLWKLYPHFPHAPELRLPVLGRAVFSIDLRQLPGEAALDFGVFGLPSEVIPFELVGVMVV